MTTKVRVGFAGVMLAAMIALVCASSVRSGGPEKGTADAIIKLADVIKKGDADAIKKAGAATAKLKVFDDTGDLMHLFKPRNKEGMGWGPKEGKNPALDGLEKKVQEYAKKVTGADASDPGNEDAAYWIAALAEITKYKVPDKDQGGGKTKKAWSEFANQMSSASMDFAKAVKTKKADNIKTAAEKLNNTCLNCHSKFRTSN